MRIEVLFCVVKLCLFVAETVAISGVSLVFCTSEPNGLPKKEEF